MPLVRCPHAAVTSNLVQPPVDFQTMIVRVAKFHRAVNDKGSGCAVVFSAFRAQNPIPAAQNNLITEGCVAVQPKLDSAADDFQLVIGYVMVFLDQERRRTDFAFAPIAVRAERRNIGLLAPRQ